MTPVRVGLCFEYRLLFSRRVRHSLESLDILIFPELLDGGYGGSKRRINTHHPGDPLISDFVTASMTLPCYIIAGSISYVDHGGLRTNTSLVFYQGRLVHRYDKIHLFKPSGDDRLFTPGSSVRPFVLNVGGMRLRAGVVICYDIRFPELVRSLAQQGVRILFVPARWPVRRNEAWQTLLKARAIENQIFVIGCNARGPEGGISYAFDPLGKRIVQSRSKATTQLVAFDLDLEALATSRTLHSNLDDAVLLRERTPIRQLKIRPARRGRVLPRRAIAG